MYLRIERKSWHFLSIILEIPRYSQLHLVRAVTTCSSSTTSTDRLLFPLQCKLSKSEHNFFFSKHCSVTNDLRFFTVWKKGLRSVLPTDGAAMRLMFGKLRQKRWQEFCLSHTQHGYILTSSCREDGWKSDMPQTMPLLNTKIPCRTKQANVFDIPPLPLVRRDQSSLRT